MSVRDATYMLGEAMRELDYLVPHIMDPETQTWRPAQEKLDAMAETWEAFKAAYIKAFGAEAFGEFYPY